MYLAPRNCKYKAEICGGERNEHERNGREYSRVRTRKQLHERVPRKPHIRGGERTPHYRIAKANVAAEIVAVRVIAPKP